MLARFGIDEDALIAPDADIARLTATHRNAVQLLLEIGELVCPGGVNSFAAAVGRAPVSVRQMWYEALANLYVEAPNPPPVAFDAITSIAQLATEWGGRTDVVLFETGRAHRLGLPMAQSSYIEGISNIEVSRFDLADQCIARQRIEALARSVVSEGDSRDQFWTERILPLARRATHISIVDRYAVRNLYHHLIGGRNADAGLRWFLEQLNADARNLRSLTIYTVRRTSRNSWISDANARQGVAAALAALVPRRLLPVSLVFADDGVFRRTGHDRVYRFDRHAVHLGGGLDVFADVAATKLTVFGRVVYKSALSIEDALAKSATDRPML